MFSAPGVAGRLLAISDLHVAFPENRRLIEDLRPQSTADWLIIAGDVAERLGDVEWALRLLSRRFAQVVWVPGNHELWTHPTDPDRSTGNERYWRLIDVCRGLGVLTPEDAFVVWDGKGGPVTVAPLFVPYDYTFAPPGTASAADAIGRARAQGVLSSDEWMLHADPYPGIDAWCRARVELSERRLAERSPTLPTLLINHFPLVREPTTVLRPPELALWCGTALTADWHVRFRAAAVVYGHLHVPRRTWHDGVPFHEVSLGYPRDWRRRSRPHLLHEVLPVPVRV